MENKYPYTNSVEDVDLTLRFNDAFQSAKKIWKKVTDFLLKGGKLVGEVKLIYVSCKDIKGEKRLSVYGAGYKQNNSVVFVPISVENQTYETNESGFTTAVKQIEAVVKTQADFECARDKESVQYFIQILSKLFISEQQVTLEVVQGGFHVSILSDGQAGLQLRYAIAFLENYIKSLEK